MEKQTIFVEMLFNDLICNIKKHIKNKREGQSKWYSANYMNKDCGKVALKRKIIYLRQELLNLEKMLND